MARTEFKYECCQCNGTGKFGKNFPKDLPERFQTEEFKHYMEDNECRVCHGKGGYDYSAWESLDYEFRNELKWQGLRFEDIEIAAIESRPGEFLNKKQLKEELIKFSNLSDRPGCTGRYTFWTEDFVISAYRDYDGNQTGYHSFHTCAFRRNPTPYSLKINTADANKE